jgi:two-component system cell cycle response regulator CpdR
MERGTAAMGVAAATVLVVEDDRGVRDVARRALEDAGYRVLIADAPEAAAALARDEDVDLLLTDVVLPVQSGYELAEQLQAAHPGMRVLFITGWARERAGPREDVLFKPFSLGELVEAVRRTLDA